MNLLKEPHLEISTSLRYDRQIMENSKAPNEHSGVYLSNTSHKNTKNLTVMKNLRYNNEHILKAFNMYGIWK